jgi:hypothetical protein
MKKMLSLLRSRTSPWTHPCSCVPCRSFLGRAAPCDTVWLPHMHTTASRPTNNIIQSKFAVFDTILICAKKRSGFVLLSSLDARNPGLSPRARAAVPMVRNPFARLLPSVMALLSIVPSLAQQDTCRMAPGARHAYCGKPADAWTSHPRPTHSYLTSLTFFLQDCHLIYPIFKVTFNAMMPLKLGDL